MNLTKKRITKNKTSSNLDNKISKIIKTKKKVKNKTSKKIVSVLVYKKNKGNPIATITGD